jgi:hypothetical protein
MGARSDFGHNAAKGSVMILLSCKRMRQNRPVRPDDCRCGFVAARFKTKDYRHPLPLRAAARYGQAA